MKLNPELLEHVAKILEKYDLAEFHYEEDGCEFHIVRKLETQVPMMTAVSLPASSPQTSGQQIIAAPQPASAPVDDATVELVTSPIVGTAYLAAEPGAPAFIKVGDRVEKDQVILIIEAMKVMNQLKAPVSGTIKEICVANAKPVEFGEVLVKISKG